MEKQCIPKRTVTERRSPHRDAEKELHRILLFSIMLAPIGAIAVFLIAFTDFRGSIAVRIFTCADAAVFWSSLAAQTLLTVKARRKRRLLQGNGYNIRKIRHASIGAMSFFKNREAAIFDVLLFASAVSFAIVVRTNADLFILLYGSLSLLFLSFSLHCILNGKNYRYDKEIKKIKKEHK